MMEQEKMELSHDPIPGYKPVFFAVCVVAVVYLVLTFLLSSH